MEYIEAKSILQTMRYGSKWYGIDYNMNLYRGCNHGCIYCDSRSECYQIDAFDRVRIKKECISILEGELLSKRKKGVIGIGAMSDAYNTFERKYEITRKSLQLIQKYGFGVCLQTKSTCVTRDIDILKKIKENHSVCIGITITAYKDEISKKIEPYAPPSSKRFEAVKTLSNAGIFTGVLLNPLLPFITDSDENIKELVRMSYESGAKFVHTYLGVTLRDKQRDYFYQKIEKEFPSLKQEYKRKYGSNYICAIPNIKRKWTFFTKECEKYGLLYKMEDIIRAYKKEIKQFSLFEI